MLQEISWDEFLEWIEYASLEPFDETRADYRAASICALIANVNRDRRSRPSPFQVSDFLLLFGEDEKPREQRQTWQQQKMLGQMIAIAFNESN